MRILPKKTLRPNGRRAQHLFEALEQRCLLTATPLISEFMAINTAGITDENADHSDWLEIYNPGSVDLNLNGYFLTDDANNLTKWQLPAVTVPSGGYLTVFADSKDRRVVGSPLHTNFNISGGGGYLALVATNGSTLLSDYNYPQQVADISYGVPVSQDSTKLLLPQADTHVLVPQDGSLGTTWKDSAFIDSAWTSGKTGVGYEADAVQPFPPGFGVRMLDTAGGTDGNLSDRI